MKRFILVILAIFSVNFVFAEEQEKSTLSSAVERVYNDVTDGGKILYQDGKDIVKEIYPEVKGAIVSIAKGLGVAAEHVYEVLVKKFVVDGIARLAQLLVGIAFFLFGFIKLNKRLTSNDFSFTYREVLYIVYSLIGFIICIKIPYTEMFLNLINPEWGAINYVLDYTKSLMH